MALSLKLPIKYFFFNTVHNIITFSMVFTNKNGEGTLSPLPPIRTKVCKPPIITKVNYNNLDNSVRMFLLYIYSQSRSTPCSQQPWCPRLQVLRRRAGTPAPPTPLFLNSGRLGSKGVSQGPMGEIIACLITCLYSVPLNTFTKLNSIHNNKLEYPYFTKPKQESVPKNPIL